MEGVGEDPARIRMEETDTGGKESQEMEEKPRWIDLFQRESHRQFQMEYLRDKEYEEVSAGLGCRLLITVVLV